ncbi:MvdC/MvdD family ATP grasp protein [Kineococcus sp. SYSU DK002]|uniref:MvdC/MvdD family ATP grasp protein n=1 Tax=Kineococcus sp. SYSU DK002 TaxID=3383123 RepID=UPI003D7EAB36
MILALSARDDATTSALVTALRERGANVLAWDPATLPATSALTVRVGRQGLAVDLDTDREQVDLTGVRAVWYRAPGQPDPLPTADPAHQRYAALQCHSLVAGLWELLDVPWVPGRYPAMSRAHNKAVNLALARAAGFHVPETLFTNDPRELVPAHRRAGGDLIAKPVEPTGVLVDGQEHRTYTTPVGRRMLTSRHRLRAAPVVLQPRVPKALELRVVVVDDAVFSFSIDSQASRVGVDDWRHYDHDRVSYREHRLPDDVRRRCARFVSSLGLTYAALDLVLTPHGQHVFLEVNPTGEYGWLEEVTGAPITSAIADHLVAATTTAGVRHDHLRPAASTHAPVGARR